MDREGDYLERIIAEHKRGRSVGIESVCSSNPYVLEAALQQARQDGRPVLIESTSNQVNQFGGYMGLTPIQFRESLLALAERVGLGQNQVLLGGDHLGPNAWQSEPEASAMPKAARLVADCILAGYVKIHLDASMRLADDPEGPLEPETAARRAAKLCRSAEDAWRELPPGTPPPRYVVGTEVPVPGGTQEAEPQLEVTPVARARATLEIHQAAFARLGLEPAWERTIALVVQPGVEFGDEIIHPYQRDRAQALSRFIEGISGRVFEAHSTDYQTPQALGQMVEDHFAILKVGPGLTFAFREAVFALERIEAELLKDEADRSHLAEVMEAEMLAEPGDWAKYYHGSAEEQRLARRYSLSDRIRYYWNRPGPQEALARLLANLEVRPIPITLISQYLPVQFRRILQGELELQPRALIFDKIGEVLRDYRAACWSG